MDHIPKKKKIAVTILLDRGDKFLPQIIYENEKKR